MKLDQKSSVRLNLLRFLPIVGVVYVHAYGTVVAYSTGSVGVAPDNLNYFTEFVRIFVAQGLARISVPLFFMMAGYFLLINFQWSFPGFSRKVKARMRSLAVPLLLWNLSMFGLMAVLQAIPRTQPYFTFTGPKVLDYTPYEFLDAIIGIGGMPIDYHFWFIRDLILMVVLLAPCLSLLCRYASKSVFTAFLVIYFGFQYYCWVTNSWPLRMPDVPAVLFFSIGALCASKNVSLFSLDKYGPAALVIWGFSLIPDTIWQHAWFNDILHRSFIPVGVVGALYATKLVLRQERLTKTLVALGGASFFVYAAHEPLLGIARLIAYSCLPLDNDYAMVLIFLILPSVVIGILLRWYRAWGHLSPKSLALFTGGR